MTITKYKVYFAWDYEKEEAWLNEMSNKGYQLVHVGIFKYVFEVDHSKRYIYRLELLDQLPSHPSSVDYMKFLEETGVECVSTILRWAYFRKEAGENGFELYSDIASRIKHYKRIQLLFIAVTPVNVMSIINMGNIYLRTHSLSALIATILVVIIVLMLATGLYRVSMQIAKLSHDKLFRE